MKTETVLGVFVVLVVLSLSLGFAIGHSFPRTETTTKIVDQTFTTTQVIVPDLTTQTIDCSGVPVCGLTSNYVFTDNTTTVIIFAYPASNTTSEYTLTLTHPTSAGAASTVKVVQIASFGVGEEYFYNGTCTEPYVAYSTTTTTSYQINDGGNFTEGVYSVISTTSTTNLTPYTSYYLSTNANCNPNANGTITETSTSK